MSHAMRAFVLFPAAVALLCAGAAHGQAATFTARPGRNPVGVGESFPFEVTLTMENGSFADYRPPDFRGFRVLAEQKGHSTQFQLGGGGSLMRETHTWHYQLAALKKGKLTIGAASVRADGRELHTEKVNVTVVEAGQAPQPRAPRGYPGFPGIPDPRSLFPGFADDDDNQPPPDPGRAEGQRNFLRVLPSKTRAFVGEQITIEWSLCLGDRQYNLSPTKEPRTDGFWVEDLEVPQGPQGPQFAEEVIDGRVYRVAPLMRKALFGLKAGKVTVTAFEANLATVVFFGAPRRSEHLKSDPVAIEIVPLPAGAPAGFDPSAVGTFTLSADVDRDHVQVGEAITLKVKLTGQGNLRKIALPGVPRLPGWKLYEPKVAVELERNTAVSGSKTAEYLLLPEQPGQTQIPPLAMTVFDTQKASYATLTTAPIPLTVTGQAAAPAPVVAVPTPAAAGSENLLAIDVRPLRNRPTLRRDLGSALYHSPVLLGVVVVPPALLGLLSLAGVARARFGQETPGQRRRRLRRQASRRLRTATTLLHEGRLAPSLAEIERVLRELLAGKLGATAAGMSRDELRAALAAAGGEPTLLDGLVAALDDCDRARFAPGSITSEEASRAIDRASELIEDFEKLGARPGGEP
jgi:hypothetical protein